ncbi:MAG: S8 family serine peptidase [Dehalococcoidia bacterium]
MMKHRISKALLILAVIFLLSVFLSGIFSDLPHVLADDTRSKITGALHTTLLEKSSGARTVTGISASAAKPDSVDVFIYLDQQPDAAKLADLAAAGVTVYPDTWIPPTSDHPRGFITATLPIVNLDGLAAKSYVAKIDSAERTAKAQNDVAAQFLGTQSYWPSGFTGKGVKVAVLDSGLDITHPDIPKPIFQKDVSDISYVHDNVTSPIPGGSAHGTHVAGSILGRGTASNGKYKGMAYDADLIFLKIGDNVTTDASTAAMVKALKDSIDVYKADIISMSYGGWDDFHDGSAAECQAADYAVSKGATVFISAGNEADDARHFYFGTLGAGQTTGYIQVNVNSDTGDICKLYSNLVWYDGKQSINNLTLQYYDSSFNSIMSIYSTRQKSDRGTSQQYWYYGDSANVYTLPTGTSTYYIRVSNTSTSSQSFHLYLSGGWKNSGRVKFQSPDLYYTVGSPADADGVICVGACTTRDSWTDYTGQSQNYGQTLNTLCSFSSRGPRVDTGAPRKPDIVTPGSAIISCRDRSQAADKNTVSDNGINDGNQPIHYRAMQGTSMACPIAAGSAAILMQAYPGLKGNPAKVKDVMRRSASQYTSPNNDWGYGLLNLLRVLQILPKQANTYSQGNGSGMTFSTDLGTINIVQKASAQASSAKSLYFPYGAYSYKVSLLQPSGSAHVTINMPADASEEYWEFADNNWQQITPLSAGGDRMVLQLQDGGTGDSDHQLDGDIEDIGGPAVPSASNIGMGAGTPTGISGGASATPSLTPQAMALPSIVVQNASISNTTVSPGEEVRLTARIANTGTANGRVAIRIYVNGEEEQQQAVIVDGGQVLPMQFSIQRNEPGTYNVLINNVSAGTFTVEDAASRDMLISLIFISLISGIVLVSILLWRRTRTSV